MGFGMMRSHGKNEGPGESGAFAETMSTLHDGKAG